MTKPDPPVFVTQPSLPDLEEFLPYLRQIWESKQLTNNGPFHRQLEQELAEFLGVKQVSLFTNGTLALVTALQALNITGEVITTPYSFVATSHALWWNNITPVFVDIDPRFGNLEPAQIESAITSKTTAILPVHVYGNPCETEMIQSIANQHGLRVIYDAAHAFGVNYKGTSILNWGDLSILSFHATKPYNTMEGGAIISHDSATKQAIDYLKNFGFDGETTVMAPGINSKMNEMQAALGLIQLKYHQREIDRRAQIARLYKSELSHIPGLSILPVHPESDRFNFGYYPIFIDKDRYGHTRDELYFELRQQNIFGRRYFYPLISHFPMYQDLPSANPENLPIAESFASQVICLPIYASLSTQKAVEITRMIRDFHG